MRKEKNMRKTKTFRVAVSLLAALGLGATAIPLSACNPAVVASLSSINADLTKLNYEIGEEFDLSTLKVTGVYSDNSTKDLTVDATVTGFDSSKPGDVVLTITVNGVSVNVTIHILRSLASISVENTKAEYYTGDELDESALTVTATYTDGTSEEISLDDDDLIISGFDTEEAADSLTVTVSFRGQEATFNVKVIQLEVVSFVAELEEDALVFYGDELADVVAQLIVTATYNSGKVEELAASEFEVEGFNGEALGEQVLTINVGESSHTVNIVVLNYATKIEFENSKEVYNDGESFDENTISAIVATMADGSTRDLTLEDVEFAVPETFGSKAGQEKITMSYCYGSATIVVSVLPPADEGAGQVGNHTYYDYTTVSPSNWNELTYQDNNDTDLMGYLSGNFFNFNYKFDESGNILDGQFEVEFDAVSAVEDVTATYAGSPDFSVPEGETSGYAYKFTLREDLKWDDGTPIDANDFVYTMQEQLNPLFQNYRADSYYNSGTVIHNAKAYVKNGLTIQAQSKSAFGGVYSEENDADLIFDSYLDGKEGDEDSYILSWFAGGNPSYAGYLAAGSYGVFIIPYLYGGTAMSPADCMAASRAIHGKTLAEIKADSTLSAYWDEIIGWWQTDPGEELDFFTTPYSYPELDWDEDHVGLFVGENKYELIIVLDKTLEILEPDGSLSYKAAYNFASLPLVKQDLYERCKREPQEGSKLWTTVYNTSRETSASWGPYKLTYFQSGKQYRVEKNDNWYGYGMDKYQGQYQTNRIVCNTIAEWNTAWLAFQQGDISQIGIDVSIASEYKASSRAVYTASDFVGSMQLQSTAEALKKRESDGVDKEMLLYKDFRQALSLAIDRVDYATTCTTASLAGFGLFNSMHYYDVAHGGVYRNEDVAKEVICEVYGIDVQDYDSLDEAYAAVTGYNLDLARELLEAAYDEALAAGTISETDKVVLTYGSSEDNSTVRRNYDYLNAAFKKLAEGTSLEGRLELDFNASFGSKWADSFRDGAYDICQGGWSGAAWDPGYFLLAYLSPDYMYSQGWDTSKHMLAFNPWGDDNEDHELEMSLMEWYDCLNGLAAEDAEFNYDWSEGKVDNAFRLRIIAALEKEVLNVYYTVPLYNSFSASLRSYRIEFGSNTYNTFMGYGGLRYMTYNYDDAQWEAVKGTFDYKN